MGNALLSADPGPLLDLGSVGSRTTLSPGHSFSGLGRPTIDSFKEQLDGLMPRFSVAGVDFVVADIKAQCSPDVRKPKVVSYLEAVQARTVVIADTPPTEGLLRLVRDLVDLGIKVHYLDHHKPEGGRLHTDNGKADLAIAGELERILNRSGGVFKLVTREEAPACALMFRGPYLLECGADCFLTGRSDLDSIGTFLKGVGVRYDFGYNARTLELDLALIDSPFADATNAMHRAAKGSSRGGFEQPMVPEIPISYHYTNALFALGILETLSDSQLYKLNRAFARCSLRESLEGPDGDYLRKLGDAGLECFRVLCAIVAVFSRREGHFLTLDFAGTSLSSGGTLETKRLLAELDSTPDTSKEQAREQVRMAQLMLGKNSARLSNGRVRHAVRNFMGEDCNFMLVQFKSDRKAEFATVTPFGAFAKLDFEEIRKSVGVRPYQHDMSRGTTVLRSQWNTLRSAIEREASMKFRGRVN